MTTDACPDLATLAQLVDGELEPSLTTAAHRHAGRCARCGPRVAALERAADAGRAAMPQTPPAPRPGRTDACLSESQLAGYVTLTLAADERQRAESHLAGCDLCLIAADEALATTHALARAPLAVPATLQARVASRWPATTPSTVARLAIAIGRTGLRLLEQHLGPPVLAIEAELVPLAALRAGEERAALSVLLRAENGEIRATIVSDDEAVAVTLRVLGSEGAPLGGQRLYVRQHGSSIFSARTDANGELRLPRLEPGVYDVECAGIQTTFVLDLRT
jgi:anti-sigma factor RsiW